MGPSGWREGCGPSGIGQDDTTQSSPSDRRGNQGTDPRHSSNPNSGFLGNRVPESLFHLPQCCLGSPTHGAMWEAAVPSGLVSPTGKYAPAASGAPPLISSCPGSLRPTLQDLERYLQRNLTASQKRRPSPGTPDALKTRSSLLRISSPRLQESALECPSAPSANPSEQALLPTLTPAPWICHKQPSPSFMPPDLSLCSFHHLECSSPT